MILADLPCNSSGLGGKAPLIHGHLLEAYDFGGKQICNETFLFIYLSL